MSSAINHQSAARRLKRKYSSRQLKRLYRATQAGAEFVPCERDSGQHPKFDKPRKHKAKPSIKPTWPNTLDQDRQSRPVHVLHPNREPDKQKRCKPKSAAAKRMDRPERVAMVDRGMAKLMRWFGA